VGEAGAGTPGRHRAGSPAVAGIAIAALTLVVDQGHKWWMLEVFRIGDRGRTEVLPFLDLVLVWNRGISYGWLQQDSDFGRWALVIVGFGAAALFAWWLSVTRSRTVATALGLIIGGAVGNAIDRIVFGAVADFFSFHAFGFYWYVFNLADAAIVAGVGLLLYDSFRSGRGGPHSQSA